MTRRFVTLASRLLLALAMLAGGAAPLAGQTLVSTDTIQVAVYLQNALPAPSLRTDIQPAEAVSNGAMWRLVGTGRPWRSSEFVETDLDPLTTYTVRFKELLTPSPGWTAAPQSLVVAPGETAVVAGTYRGNISATLGPSEAISDGAQWRIVGHTGWLDSGQVRKGLPAGTYSIRFKDVAQADSTWWTTPDRRNATTDRPASISVTYFRTALETTIFPTQAVAEGAAWRAIPPLPGNPRPWRDSGCVETGLPLGTCFVKYGPLPGWEKPASQTLTISADALTSASGFYRPSLTVVIEPPEAVSAEAAWRVALPAPAGPWRNGGDTLFLPVDDPCTTYTILARSVPGWKTPTVQALGLDRPTTLTLTYLEQFTVAFATDGTPGAWIAGINPQVVAEGEICAPVTARAPAGRCFEKWTCAGVDYSWANPLIVADVAQDMTLVGHFAPSSLIVSDSVPAGCLAGILRAGARTYADREHLFEPPVPKDLDGQPYILTCNDDRLSSAGLQFRINRSASVVVAFDPRIAPLPQWLSTWTRMDGTLLVDEPQRERVLFARPFEPGLVALGPNVPDAWEASAPCSMFTVVVKEVFTTAVPAERWNLYW